VGVVNLSRKPKTSSVADKKVAEHVREFCCGFDEEILLADGFNEAFLGVIERCASKPVACYDAERCVKVLMELDGMSHDEAEEFFDFNTAGAYVGEYTPYFLYRFKHEV